MRMNAEVLLNYKMLFMQNALPVCVCVFYLFYSVFCEFAQHVPWCIIV